MKLSDLLSYPSVTVQCHDNPDADAIASGWALYLYFKSNNIPVRFIYGGKFEIKKSNLMLMIDNFNIPIEYVTELNEEPPLLITVDCQYGEGNVWHFDAKTVATIDHHRVSGKLPLLNEVRSNLGSCSTLMWDLLNKERFDVNENSDLATALYYGLLTDTNGFAELSHPLDRDLRDELVIKRSYITLFRNSNLSFGELKIAGEALENSFTEPKYKYGMIEAKPCDPNILGVISDMFLEVDCIECCVVYSILEFGIKLSIRSCVKEVKSNEFVEYLTEGIGSGGGHIDKAGGFIDRKSIEALGISYDPTSIHNFIKARIDSYFDNTEIIYVKDYTGDLSGYPVYNKKALHLGYVDPSGMGLGGKTVYIRTMEGDLDIVIKESTYIMIGIEGEIYPSDLSHFEKSYIRSDEPYIYGGEYEPVIKDSKTGEKIAIIPHAKSCISTGKRSVYAKKLDHRVKLFTTWDEEKYYLAKPGDYLVSVVDNPRDVYIVEAGIFAATYEEVR